MNYQKIRVNNFIRKFLRKYCRNIINIVRTANIFYKKKYTLKNESYTENLVIFFVDGYMIHGGLADRLKGIVSTYLICKAKALPFRLVFNYPFDIDTYLLPNIYNWKLRENEIVSYSMRNSLIINVHNDFTANALFNICDNNKQYHVYGNVDIIEKANIYFNQNFNWSVLYNELFKPSSYLNSSLQSSTINIGREYIALHFRFQQLLGDFQDPGQILLDKESQNKLINNCIKSIVELKDFELNPLVVFSDSNLFLNIAKRIEGIYFIDGDISHMDYFELNKSVDIHLKTFVDFYMIRNANKVYIANNKLLRVSGFSEFAAISNNKDVKLLNVEL